MAANFSLEKILIFNDQLATLDDLGIPLDLGFDDHPYRKGNQARRLRELSAQLALHSNASTSEQKILSDKSLPEVYRNALATWLHSESPARVLQTLSSPAAGADRMTREIQRSLIQPLTVFFIALVGFCFFCVYLYPRLNRLYEHAIAEPSEVLKWFTGIADSMSTWIWIAPLVAIAVFIALWKFIAQIRPYQLVGGTRARQLDDAARCSAQAACLIESGHSLEKTKSLVIDGASVADVRNPLLNWAASAESTENVSAPMFRVLHRFYRRLAERRAYAGRTFIPMMVCVFLGAGIVLAYSLSLFLPVIAMFFDLSMAEFPMQERP